MEAAETGKECGAKKPDGGFCKNPAGFGTDHLGFGTCKRHMGCTPGPAKGAYRQMVKAMGDPVGVEPVDAIIGVIASTAGHVAWLERKIGDFKFPERAKLDDDGVETIQFMTPNQAAWWKIYQEERDRLVRYGEVAIRAGLAERAVRLAEAQGEMMAQAIDRILAGLNLTDEQLALVPNVVPMVMRSVPMIIENTEQEGAS